MPRIESTDVFDNWIDGLKDRVGRSRIQARIERLAHGNPGHHRALTNGVCELKIDVGPGYRVYFTDVATLLSCYWPVVINRVSRATSILQ